MRRPLRKALLWLGLALAGASVVLFVVQAFDRLGDVASLIIGTIGGTAIPFGLIYGVMCLLSAIGELRLKRGIGVIARWQVSAAEWEVFRAFAARRASEAGAHPNDFTPNPAEGRAVEVLFGRHQVMIDESYHLLRRWGLPELRGLGWLQPADAMECIEFDLAYPRSRFGGIIPMALRIPVPLAAREDGVRVFYHFKAKVPVARVGIAFRRPWLVIGWGLGVSTAAGLVACAGLLMQMSGDESLLALLLLVCGILVAAGAWLFTLIILLATRPWRKQA